MSAPSAPPFDELAGRVFSFYPPILNVEHNEWRLKEATWSELLVDNTQGKLEVAVPRGFVGPVSQVDKPVMIVGLTRELEYKAGQVWPTARKIVPMPVNPMTVPPRLPGQEAEMVGPTGLEAMLGPGGSATENRISRMIFVTFGSVITLGLLIFALVRFTPDAKPTFTAKDQSYLELTRESDYFDVVRKLGQPSADRWKPGEGELKYRALVYKDRGYAVILMGTERDNASYIGTIGMGAQGKDWSPLHHIESARGASTAAMLRNLPRF